MKVGGRHRIVVPDLEVYCRGYLNYHDNFLSQYRDIDSDIQTNLYETRGSIFISQFYEHGHKMVWDFETLLVTLEKIGYKNIKRTACRESDFPDLPHLETTDTFRVSESLYVECEKW